MRAALKTLWRKLKSKTFTERADQIAIKWMGRPEKPCETWLLNRIFNDDYVTPKP